MFTRSISGHLDRRACGACARSTLRGVARGHAGARADPAQESLVKQTWITLIERPNIERAAAVHTTSTIEAHHLAGFGWTLPRLAVIPHGVDDPPSPSGEALSPDVLAALAARRQSSPSAHQLGEGARSLDRACRWCRARG
jgi:hypothetical protein